VKAKEDDNDDKVTTGHNHSSVHTTPDTKSAAQQHVATSQVQLRQTAAICFFPFFLSFQLYLLERNFELC